MIYVHDNKSDRILLNGNLNKKCSQLLYEIYDGVYEFDFAQDKYRVIRCIKNEYIMPVQNERLSVVLADLVDNLVYPADQERVKLFFKPEYLHSQFDNSGISNLTNEFRVLAVGRRYKWLQVKIVPIDRMNGNVVICYFMDIEQRKLHDEIDARLDEKRIALANMIFTSIGSMYTDVFDINLHAKEIFVLKSSFYVELEGQHCDYYELFYKFSNEMIAPNDRAAVMSELSLQALEKFITSEQKYRSWDARCSLNGQIYEWMEMSVFKIRGENNTSKQVLLTIRNVNEQKVLRGIVDKIIYNNCDFCLYLDSVNNSYVIFSASDNGTAMPKVNSSDYESEFAVYAAEHVVLDDRQDFVEQIRLDTVLASLERDAQHNVYFGVIDPKRGYRRKRLQYLYHDRAVKMLLVILTDITQIYNAEKKRNAMLQKALEEARTDSLTKLYNQKTAADFIDRKLRQAAANAVSACYFIDIDNFKLVNDSFGHFVGDEVLRYVGLKLKSICSENDVVGRIGGDEFIMLMTNVESAEDIQDRARRICDIFTQVDNDMVKDTGVSCSVGVAVYPADGEDYEALSLHADQALYYAKNSGKNQFALYGMIPERERQF